MLGVLPWFVPGVLISVTLALVAWRVVAKRFDLPGPVAWAILVGFGLVLSATLTPLRGGLDLEAVGTGTCDLSRIVPAPLGELRRLNDSSLNVALFIPLGIAIGLVPRVAPGVALILVAIALPFAIEAIQLLAPILDRGCQSADVVDNLTGLAVGLVVAMGFRLLDRLVRHERSGGS